MFLTSAVIRYMTVFFFPGKLCPLKNPHESSCSLLVNQLFSNNKREPAQTDTDYRLFTLDRYPGFGYSAQAVTDWGIVQW